MRFLGTKADGKVVILGVPFEETVSFRPGTRFAPVEVRKVSDGIETYSPYLNMDIEEESIGDLGDLELPIGNREKGLVLIKKEIEKLLGEGRKVLSIGGEHLLSLAAVEAYAGSYSNLVVLHIDAHTDARGTYLGERLSHATVMRRVRELGVDVCQVGVRSGLREEFGYCREKFLFFHPFSLPCVDDIKKLVSDRPVYLSLDVDVLDPAFCPGVGTPEPGGVSYRELVNFLASLKGLDLVGADVVELCPERDPSGNSAVVGASILREVMLLLSLSSRYG